MNINPFRPGAGHIPPYLAGRTAEQETFRKLLQQKTILENLILTGLRGVGKTVLLETLKPIAREHKWLWTGTDLSESVSVSEEQLAIRILSDMALIVSSIIVSEKSHLGMGFETEEVVTKEPLSYDQLINIYQKTPGLVSDKLKRTLEFVWSLLNKAGIAGVVFAYDEAQTLSDHKERGEYPLSLLLEVFQSVQRKDIPFMLLLTGLPTLCSKLVGSRTYAERMFHVVELHHLNEVDSRDAIVKPMKEAQCTISFTEATVRKIIELSGGYPYFIQFICKEFFDIWINKSISGESPRVSEEDIIRKLDTNFFQGRWSKATDRQQELLKVIACLPHCDDEFTVQELVAESKNRMEKGFSPSHANQMLSYLVESGLVYKNRHGKYSLAVPLLSRFIKRQFKES